jgi:hypothetical protein
MRGLGVALLSAASLAGCHAVKVNDPGVICTAIAVSSLNVTVRDAATGQLLCDAAVTAIQGGTTYTLRQTGDCRYAGPEERDGTFEVRAARAGYAASAVGNVRVGKDECHVIPVAVMVDLHPGP